MPRRFQTARRGTGWDFGIRPMLPTNSASWWAQTIGIYREGPSSIIGWTEERDATLGHLKALDPAYIMTRPTFHVG